MKCQTGPLSRSAAATGGIPLQGNGGHSNFLHQVALARVERAKLGHANQLGGVGEAYQFTQKEQDIESGLDYFEARYRAATLGRFITVNPREHNESPQDLNGYAYVGN